jgi:hypothetical protein
VWCNAAMTRMPAMKGATGFNGWRHVQERRKACDFTPETHSICGSDKLLSELQVSEEQAMMAVECGDELGQKLRIFVRRVCQERYIPEHVLCLLQLTRRSGFGALMQALISGFSDDGSYRKARYTIPPGTKAGRDAEAKPYHMAAASRRGRPLLGCEGQYLPMGRVACAVGSRVRRLG